MRTLSLCEYETSEGVPLTQAELDGLASAVSTLQISPTSGQPGHYNLRPASVVGVVNLGTVRIEIRPKLPIDRVLFLVSYALDPEAWERTPFGFATSPSLVAAIVPGFIHQLEHAFARGLLRGYRHTEEALSTVRGRIDLQQLAKRRFGRTPPIDVRYDDFTEDIEENRLLRAAIRRVTGLRILPPSLSRLLLPFDYALGSVEHVEYHPHQLPDLTYSRLNRHYERAVELAKLILQWTTIELGHGIAPSSVFLVDMNSVFEDFVVVALREALGLSKRNFPQGARGRPLYLDEDRRLTLKPDVSWWEGQECVFVGDVKYKKLNTPYGLHPDIYQLLAYLTATGLDRGLLIYAAGEAEPIDHDIRRVTKQVKIATVDPRGEPAEILGHIASLAAEISEMRRSRQRAA